MGRLELLKNCRFTTKTYMAGINKELQTNDNTTPTWKALYIRWYQQQGVLQQKY